MSRALRPGIVAVMMLALVLPSSALAARDPRGADAGPAATFDTPKPTPRPRANKTPRPTRKPTRKPTPAPKATPAPTPIAAVFAPARGQITVGYRQSGALGQAPLLIAELAGYFNDAGLEVRLVEVEDTLADVLSGDLDFGVVGARSAYAASSAEPGLRSVAGYQNYAGEDGAYGGDLLLATPGLVAQEPATVIAFLSAYVRALQDLAEEESALEALARIDSTQLAVDPDVAAEWPARVDVFAPFDGGFGAVEEGGGLGELAAHLAGDGDSEPDLQPFVAQHTLNTAQAWLDLAPNPDTGFAGAPNASKITVGMPLDADLSPVTVAIDSDYFDDAGFDSVEIVPVEHSLPGVLTGQLDLGIVDTVDAAEAVNQGLPLAVLAGHANQAADGSYGGDVLVASSDLLISDRATLGAFLIAYVRALRDLSDSVNAGPFTPHDGGFGAVEDGAGLGQLDAYLETNLGSAPDLQLMIDSGALEYAQAWWGLPANPVGPGDADATPEGQ